MAEKKFFNKYPYTDFHEMNLDWIVNKTEECVDTVSEFDTRLTTAEGNITNLQGRMTTAEGSITTLQSGVTSLQGRMTTAEGDISGLKTRMTTAEGNISTLQTNVTNLSNHDETTDRAVQALETNMTTAQGDISGLKTRMTAAESDIDALEAATTRTGVPLQWECNKGTQSGEIDLQKYGKIRVMYLHGIVENITTAITSGSGSGALMMSATLPEDSAPLENMQLLIPVDMEASPYCGLLLLKIGTDRSVEVYNYTHTTFAIGDDSPTFYFNATYMIS